MTQQYSPVPDTPSAHPPRLTEHPEFGGAQYNPRHLPVARIVCANIPVSASQNAGDIIQQQIELGFFARSLVITNTSGSVLQIDSMKSWPLPPSIIGHVLRCEPAMGWLQVSVQVPASPAGAIWILATEEDLQPTQAPFDAAGSGASFAGLPVFNVAYYGTVSAAYTAAHAAGGGIVYIPKGTYNLGSGAAHGLVLDGAVPILLQGEGPAGYNAGTILKYSGSGDALHSSATSYPPVNGEGAYFGLKDITIQCLGANYGYALYSNYLPTQLIGAVNLRGDPTQATRVGTGWYTGPSQTQLFCSFERLWIGEFFWNLEGDTDLLQGDQLISWNDYAAAIRFGASTNPLDWTIRDVACVTNLNAGHYAINLVQQGRLNIQHLEIQGDYGFVFNFTADAIGTQSIPHVGQLTGAAIPSGFAFMTGQVCPVFDEVGNFNVNSAQFSSAAFGFATPGLPTGTGSANKVQNVSGADCDVYLDATANGVHVIDWLGNDVALPSAAAGVERLVRLRNGDAIYFATAVPLAWRWYRY